MEVDIRPNVNHIHNLTPVEIFIANHHSQLSPKPSWLPSRQLSWLCNESTKWNDDFYRKMMKIRRGSLGKTHSEQAQIPTAYKFFIFIT